MHRGPTVLPRGGERTARILHIHTVNWEEVQIATSSDEHMLLLLSTIEYGIPEQRHQLYQLQSENTTNSENTYTAQTVSSSTNIELSSHLHYDQCAAHQGTPAMTSKAEASIFWPGITSDIQATRANCSQCNRMPHHKRHYHQRHRCSQLVLYI